MHVQTVSGTIGLDQLGRTLMHEHLFIAFPGAEFDPSARFDRAEFVLEARPEPDPRSRLQVRRGHRGGNGFGGYANPSPRWSACSGRR